jgi:mono/diheme cytochrome c family protein
MKTGRVVVCLALTLLPLQGVGGSERRFDPGQLERGVGVYEMHCVSCHGERGVGITPDWNKRGPNGRFSPPPLDDRAHAWHHSAQDLKRVIRNGIRDSSAGDMPAYGEVLSERDIEDLVVWITSLWSDEVYRYWQQHFEMKGR